MLSKATNKSALSPLLWVMLFDHTCLNITFPIVTLLFFDAHSRLFSQDMTHATRSLWYGLCIAIPHVVNIVMAPLWSAMSDEYGRKKILLLATFGAFLFATLATFSVLIGSLGLFIGARLLQGIFSRTNPIAQAVVGDVSLASNKVRNMGYLQIIISFGAFVGPILGGAMATFYFSSINFAFPFIIAAIIAVISVGLTYFIFNETGTVKKSPARWTHFNKNSLKQIWQNPHVKIISIILLLTQISWSLYYQFIPPILKTTFNFSAQSLGIFVGMIALWLMIASSLIIKVLEKYFSWRHMLMLSLYAVLLGLFLSALGLFLPSHAGTCLWLGACPTAAGDVIAYSCLTALYSNAVDKTSQGQVMGLCFIIVAITWSFTAFIGSTLMSINAILPLCLAPIGIVLALFLLQIKFLNLGLTMEPKACPVIAS